MYVFQLFDYYSGSRIILLIALFQCIAVAWLYGNSIFNKSRQCVTEFYYASIYSLEKKRFFNDEWGGGLIMINDNSSYESL